MDFSEIFRSLRKNKGMTQEQLSEVLGVTPQAISRWENGASYPDISMLPKIASYFDTSVDVLLGVKKYTVKQKILYFQFRYQRSADVINEHLDNGWTIKDIRTHGLDEGQHPEGMAVLEKILYE